MLNMHRWRLSPSTKLHHKALLDVNKVYNLKGKTNKISECLWESIKLCLFFTHRQRPSKVISIKKNDFVFAQTFDFFFISLSADQQQQHFRILISSLRDWSLSRLRRFLEWSDMRFGSCALIHWQLPIPSSILSSPAGANFRSTDGWPGFESTCGTIRRRTRAASMSRNRLWASTCGSSACPTWWARSKRRGSCRAGRNRKLRAILWVDGRQPWPCRSRSSQPLDPALASLQSVSEPRRPSRTAKRLMLRWWTTKRSAWSSSRCSWRDPSPRSHQPTRRQRKSQRRASRPSEFPSPHQ